MTDHEQRSRRLTQAMKALASAAEKRRGDPPEVMLGLVAQPLQHVVEVLGAPVQDAEDLTQEILIAAMLAVRSGRFDPLGVAPFGRVTARWLLAISWRALSHYRSRAYRQREQPAGLLPDEPPAEGWSCYDTLLSIPQWAWDAVALADYSMRNAHRIAAKKRIKLYKARRILRAARTAIRRALHDGGTGPARGP